MWYCTICTWCSFLCIFLYHISILAIAMCVYPLWHIYLYTVHQQQGQFWWFGCEFWWKTVKNVKMSVLSVFHVLTCPKCVKTQCAHMCTQCVHSKYVPIRSSSVLYMLCTHGVYTYAHIVHRVQNRENVQNHQKLTILTIFTKSVIFVKYLLRFLQLDC